jgi:hypothetical protein
MGLLRKAASSVPRGDAAPVPPAAAPAPAGLFRKIIASQGSGTRALGIELAPPPEKDRVLDRGDVPPAGKAVQAAADEILPSEPADEPAPVIPARQRSVARPVDEITEQIIKAMAALPQGVEIPSELFSLLVERLSIARGALLLFDPVRSVYAPWASVGYDQTTLHRMRIALGANASFNALANGAPLSVSEAASLAAYQPYFSSREFSGLSRILLAPFIAEQKLIGVLLVTEASPNLDGDEDFLSCLARLAQAGSIQVQKAREEKLQRAGAQGLRPGASPVEEASRFLSTVSPKAQVLFFSLSLEEYARKIVSAHAHLDAFRLAEDLQYFLGAFVSDIGTAIPLRQGLTLVGLQAFDAADMDLFLHQLTVYLEGLFGGNGAASPEAPPVIRKTRMWPADGTDVQELVDFLSS